MRGQTFYAASDKAKLPSAVAGKIAGVVGLSSATHYAPLLKVLPAGAHPAVSGTGPGGAYSASDLRSIYAIPTLTFGMKLQTLAVFEQGGFDPTDVQVYAQRNKLPNVPTVVRGVNGYGGSIDNFGIELEAVLDIDALIAINPNTGRIIVYEDGTDTFPVALLDSLSAMATDDSARTISISYGQDETLEGVDAIMAENTVLTQMAAQGQAVFASTGDNGAFGNQTLQLNVADPSSQPMVTAVGGTTLFNGPRESYLDEETWNNLDTSDGGAGGGISVVWPLPAYQKNVGQFGVTANGGSATFRNVPDVAAVANPLTGFAVYSRLNGGWITIGGTSLSAPLWAGFYSLVDTASKAFGFGAPGFANPGLYAVSNGPPLIGPAFKDVADGTNGLVENDQLFGFTAGIGYDNTTGVGTFVGGNLLSDLVLDQVLNGSAPPPAPTGLRATSTSTTADITWSGVNGATGYFVLIVNLATFAETSTLARGHSAVFTGLTPNSAYQYIVLSASPGGLGKSPAQVVLTAKRGS